MIEAFKNAASAPYGYLLIDLEQETDDKLRLRMGIFPGDVLGSLFNGTRKKDGSRRSARIGAA